MRSIQSSLAATLPFTLFVIVCTITTTAHAISKEAHARKAERILIDKLARTARENANSEKTPAKPFRGKDEGFSIKIKLPARTNSPAI